MLAYLRKCCIILDVVLAALALVEAADGGLCKAHVCRVDGDAAVSLHLQPHRRVCGLHDVSKGEDGAALRCTVTESSS